MKNARRTPGPWFVDDSMAGRLLINSERAAVATVPFLDREARACAALIAAAPDLLAALRYLQDGRELSAEFCAQIDAAIAKAEGGVS